jgi:hypothetical protein
LNLVKIWRGDRVAIVAQRVPFGEIPDRQPANTDSTSYPRRRASIDEASATNRRVSNKQSKWMPACAGMTTV